MSAPKWAVGMRKIGPGLYVRESDRTCHVAAEEICEALGCPPTPANLTIAREVAAQAFREAFPEGSITEVEQP